jgi:uncharacterized protein (DUF2062 family)
MKTPMAKPRRTKGMWQRFKGFVKLRILHITDTPHKIAMGVAIGLFVAWTPALGVHMLMVLALCALLRANKLAGLASTWVCNPFTFGVVYIPSYFVGRVVIDFFRGSPGLDSAEVEKILNQISSVGNIFTNFHRMAFWRELFDVLVKMGVELWVGCTIVGLMMAVAGYFLTRSFVVWHRRQNPRRRHSKFLVEK